MKSQAEMPQKELTIVERVVVLRKIREQPPNISHRQLAEITGVPRTTLAQILQDLIGPNGAYPDVTRLSGIYCTENNALPTSVTFLIWLSVFTSSGNCCKSGDFVVVLTCDSSLRHKKANTNYENIKESFLRAAAYHKASQSE